MSFRGHQLGQINCFDTGKKLSRFKKIEKVKFSPKSIVVIGNFFLSFFRSFSCFTPSEEEDEEMDNNEEVRKLRIASQQLPEKMLHES